MNPTSKPLTVTLDGEERMFYFDLNTFSAFEEVTGTFFFDFLGRLTQAVGETNGDLASNAVLQVLRKVSLKEVRALAWAAMHSYDRDDNPVWEMTLNQVGRMLDVQNIGQLLPSLLRTSTENMPKPEEVERPTVGEKKKAARKSSPLTDGGSTSGPSDDELWGSLTPKSEG